MKKALLYFGFGVSSFFVFTIAQAQAIPVNPMYCPQKIYCSNTKTSSCDKYAGWNLSGDTITGATEGGTYSFDYAEANDTFGINVCSYTRSQGQSSIILRVEAVSAAAYNAPGSAWKIDPGSFGKFTCYNNGASGGTGALKCPFIFK